MVELELGRGHHFRFTLTGLKGRTPQARLKAIGRHFKEIAEAFLANSYNKGNHALNLLGDGTIECEAVEMSKGNRPEMSVLENLRRGRLIVNPFGHESRRLEVHLRQNSSDEEYEGWNHEPTEIEEMLEKGGIEAPIRIVKRHHAAVKAVADLLVKKRIAFELHVYENNEWRKIFEHEG